MHSPERQPTTSAVERQGVMDEIERLREDNRRLSDQVKWLISTESDLYEIQEQLDGQMRIYRRLYEIGKEFNATSDLKGVLDAMTRFVLYELNFERCLVLLHSDDDGGFRTQAMDGYYDEPVNVKVKTTSISLEDCGLSSLFVDSEYILHRGSDGQENMADLGEKLQMSDFVIFPLRGESQQPNGLLVAGNSEDRNQFHARVETDGESVLGLGNLASQAATAINNAKFYEALEKERQLLEEKVEARTRELARTVDELRALGEVGQAVTSSLDLQQVLTTIVTQADQLSETDGGGIYEYDNVGKTFILRAAQKFPEHLVEALRSTPLRLGEAAVGQAAATGEVIQVPDLLEGSGYPAELKKRLTESGFRAVLSVPLMREDHVIGGLVLCRRSPGRFPARVVELVKTFAGQSALAIQNARLFKEIEGKRFELEIASRHKSEFLANMSHELRTPLNAIIGFSEVLLEGMFGELNEKQAEYLNDVLASGRHLLSLINDILDLAKVEAGRTELDLRTFSLKEAVESCLTMIRERAANHGIRLHLEIEPGTEEIQADERRVKQIISNLLSNAVKFTPDQGDIALAVRRNGKWAQVDGTTETFCANGAVEVSVSDTGIGIAPEEQQKVFEEFQQAGQSAEVAREGTGLGLPLAKRLVELHGGTMSLKSEVGVGSTFSFILPVNQSRVIDDSSTTGEAFKEAKPHRETPEGH